MPQSVPPLPAVSEAAKGRGVRDERPPVAAAEDVDCELGSEPRRASLPMLPLTFPITAAPLAPAPGVPPPAGCFTRCCPVTPHRGEWSSGKRLGLENCPTYVFCGEETRLSLGIFGWEADC